MIVCCDLGLSLLSFQGGMSVIQHYGGSLIRALLDVYPNLNLDASKFDFKTRMFEIHS